MAKTKWAKSARIKPTSFRLEKTLKDALQKKAAKQKVSLHKFVIETLTFPCKDGN
jgi:predicted HicB family RNase H-like nuclease